MKSEPVLTRESLQNLYDGSNSILLKLLELSIKHQIDFNIRISSDGGLSFESRECTQGCTYLKSIAQSKDKISYIESKISK